jgi:quinol monooxygenase YgiN
MMTTTRGTIAGTLIRAGTAALALVATIAQAGTGIGIGTGTGTGTGEMMVRIAELSIDPAQLETYKAILKTEQEASVRDEPGVLMLHSVQIADDPTQVRLLEVYASRAAYEAHIRSPHFLTYKTATERMVRALRLVETRPILLCAKSKGTKGGPITCL